MAIRLLVVEDHPAVLEGLAGLLEREGGFSVAARAGTAGETRQAAKKAEADVILLDLVLHDEDGLALIGELREIAPKSRVLVFSLHPEDIYAERCLKAGAHGYVMKQEPLPTLYAAIRTVAEGGIHVGPRVTAAMLAGLQNPGARTPSGTEAALTDRELQIYRLTGLGLATKVVAEKLGISVKTVEAHRENIKNKLGVDTHAALISRAAKWVSGLGDAPTSK